MSTHCCSCLPVFISPLAFFLSICLSPSLLSLACALSPSLQNSSQEIACICVDWQAGDLSPSLQNSSQEIPCLPVHTDTGALHRPTMKGQGARGGWHPHAFAMACWLMALVWFLVKNHMAFLSINARFKSLVSLCFRYRWLSKSKFDNDFVGV